jgi:hypothetical protein
MKHRKASFTLILIRRLLVGLAIVEFALPMFLAPAPLTPPAGLGGAGSTSFARLRFRLFLPGTLTSQTEESSPAESTDQDIETDEVPKNTHDRSGSSLRHVRLSRRRTACDLGMERSDLPRMGEALRTGCPRWWPATSPSELPVRLGRLTC